MMTERIDWNHGVMQPPIRRTNTNSLHPLQRNDNLYSEFQKFAVDRSTSLKVVEAAREVGSLQNIHECTSKTFLLSKYFFKRSHHIVSGVKYCSIIGNLVKIRITIQLHAICR